MVVTGERCKRCCDVGSLSRPVIDSQVQRDLGSHWEPLPPTPVLLLFGFERFTECFTCVIMSTFEQTAAEVRGASGSPEAGVTGSVTWEVNLGPRENACALNH